MSGAGRPVAEIAAVLLTGILCVLLEALSCARLCFIVSCVLAWGVYLAVRVGQDPFVTRAWGLRLDNLGRAALPCALLLAAAVAGMLGYRLAQGWRPLPLSSLIVFLLYPLWGFFQQFFVQALFVGNLDRLGVPRAVVVPVAAVLFGLVHVPNWVLVGLCVPAGAAWTLLFLRAPNLLPLALCHGWLGALTYYWVLGRDPLAELVSAG